MARQYNYREFVQWCIERNLEPHLPTSFEIFVDNALYTASQISATCGVHKETVLRWFRDAKLTNQSVSNAYKAEGSDIKQLLFNRPVVLGQAMERYPEFFNS